MKRARPTAVWIATAGFALVVATLIFVAVGRPVPAYPAWYTTTAYAIPLLLIGSLICARRPQERLGRLLLAEGAGASLMLATGEYATFSALGHAGRLPLTGASAWASSVTQAALVVSLIALVLIFPTGRLISPRWRPVAWAVGVDFALGIGSSGFGGPKFNSNIDFIRNPLAIHPPVWLLDLVRAGGVVIALSIVGTMAHLIIRYRRSAGEEREQLKWFLSASVFAPVLIFVPTAFFPDAMNGVLGNIAWTVGPLSVILAVGVAILRYRLYDIDVVINKSVVYGLLAAFITAVYVAIVVGIGAALGHGAAKPNLGLSIVATGVVALAFQPVRQRVQKLANRLVYGQRATPYEVLSEFSARLGTAAAAEEQLPRMARTLAEGTGASSATVWLGHGEELRPAASWPDGDVSAPAVEQTLLLPVQHHGDQLGAISLVKPPGERLTSEEDRLARDLASQAGLVLHNVRLTDELRARLNELRASRRRLVAAQDAARRRLERNIHDGAQQQLVALSVKTNLARILAGRDPERAATLVDSLRQDTERALEELAELASGLTPTALTELGLVEALRAQASRAALPITVQAPNRLEVPLDVATAIYFCVLEALQNVAKYAEASRALVRLDRNGDRVEFEVNDDGGGFDTSLTSYGTGLRGMADRLSALGGALVVRSMPGTGTTVVGTVHVHAEPSPESKDTAVPATDGGRIEVRA
jgi:signal transduction histidine kinase